MGAVVSRVEPGSVAARYGIVKGDEIITINGQLLRDIIDYYFVTSEHKLELNYLRDGFPRTTVIHKNPEDPLGLDFTEEVFDSIIPCRNKCIFCFIDQLPRGVRKTMCIKDDDYRLSFLHGNYITLTNLAENDLRRITAMRLSPLYVSIHATDPEVRSKMMGNPQAGNIMKILAKLKLHNIQCHTQIVVVPGVNDGQILRKTLGDLLNLYPTVKTVAIVPVGLTGHREGLTEIKPFDKKTAQDAHRIVTEFQEKAQKRLRFPFFYMADEIYLLMDTDFPPHKHYGYFDQLSNGVGMGRKLHTDFNRRKRFIPARLAVARNVWIVTGMLGEKILMPLMESFAHVENLKVRLVAIKNNFFGPVTTVTGLLAGQDVLAQLKSRIDKGPKPDLILLPDVVLREGRFLDDLSIEEISNELGVPVEEVPADAVGLIDGVIGEQKKPVQAKVRKKSPEVNHYDSEELPLDEEIDHQQAPTAKPLRPTGADREPKSDWSKDYQPRRPRMMGRSRKNLQRQTPQTKGQSQGNRPLIRKSPRRDNRQSRQDKAEKETRPVVPADMPNPAIVSENPPIRVNMENAPVVENAQSSESSIKNKTDRSRRGRRSRKPVKSETTPVPREQEENNKPSVHTAAVVEPAESPAESHTGKNGAKPASRRPRRRYRPGTKKKENGNSGEQGPGGENSPAPPESVSNNIQKQPITRPEKDGAEIPKEKPASEKKRGPVNRQRKSPRREKIV